MQQTRILAPLKSTINFIRNSRQSQHANNGITRSPNFRTFQNRMRRFSLSNNNLNRRRHLLIKDLDNISRHNQRARIIRHVSLITRRKGRKECSRDHAQTRHNKGLMTRKLTYTNKRRTRSVTSNGRDLSGSLLSKPGQIVTRMSYRHLRHHLVYYRGQPI